VERQRERPLEDPPGAREVPGGRLDLATATGITVPTGSTALPGASTNPDLDSTAGNTVTLGQNNKIRGLNLRNSTGIDLVGTNFGTLTTSALGLTGTGRPLSLTTGTLAATFNVINSTSSSGGTRGRNSAAWSMIRNLAP